MTLSHDQLLALQGVVSEMASLCSYVTAAVLGWSSSLRGQLKSVPGEEIPIRGHTLSSWMESALPAPSVIVTPDQMGPDLLGNTQNHIPYGLEGDGTEDNPAT